MYYQEKWVGETLYVKTTPNGQWKIKQPTLADLWQAIDQKNLSIEQGLNLLHVVPLWLFCNMLVCKPIQTIDV